jgi:hypothetical protein
VRYTPPNAAALGAARTYVCCTLLQILAAGTAAAGEKLVVLACIHRDKSSMALNAVDQPASMPNPMGDREAQPVAKIRRSMAKSLAGVSTLPGMRIDLSMVRQAAHPPLFYTCSPGHDVAREQASRRLPHALRLHRPALPGLQLSASTVGFDCRPRRSLFWGHRCWNVEYHSVPLCPHRFRRIKSSLMTTLQL